MCWLHLWDTKTFHNWWPSISWREFVIVISYPMAGCVVKRMQTMSLHSIRINVCEWIHRTYLHLCCKISKIQPHESPHVYCCLWHVICMSSESRVYKPIVTIVICNTQTRLQAPSYPPPPWLKSRMPFAKRWIKVRWRPAMSWTNLATVQWIKEMGLCTVCVLFYIFPCDLHVAFSMISLSTDEGRWMLQCGINCINSTQTGSTNAARSFIAFIGCTEIEIVRRIVCSIKCTLPTKRFIRKNKST